MAGVPISLLPDGVTPYTGEERFAFVQDSDTKANSLESFTSFYEKYFITYDLLGSLSGNWQDTYNLFTVKGAIWDISYSITSNLSSNWNSVYTTVNANSALWGRNPGDFCGTVVYMRDVTSCTGTDTINISANLDLEGYSINNIGNSSLVFESGAKFSSNAEGGVHILPNPSNIPGQYGTTIGLDNDAPASQAVASGKDSIANASMAFAHGLYNIASAPYSIAGGGKENIIDPLGLNSGIIGGQTNALSGESSGIIAGDTHKLNAYASSIMGGSAHDLRGDASIIAGGDSNIVDGGYSASIISSQSNTITRGSNSAIIASPGSTMTDADESVVIGGENTDVSSNYSAAIATNYSAITARSGVVIGGEYGYAYHNGAIVFPDPSPTPFTSLSANTFNIQARGLRLVDGNEEIGYVLTCDETGTGTWQEPSGGANVTVSDDAPLEPEGGDLWFDSDEAILYVNYIDPSQTSFWIEVGGASGSTNNTNWNSTYTTVSANSASWSADLNVVNEFQASSGGWEYTKTYVQDNSAAWDADLNVVNEFQASSGDWEATYTTVSANSASWVGGDYDDSLLQATSSTWNSAYTTVSSNSATWGMGGTSYSPVAETTVYIDAAAMISEGTGASASTDADEGTNNIIDWWNVAIGEKLYAKISMPPQWDTGDISVDIFWTLNGDNPVGESVRWSVATQAASNDDPWDTTFTNKVSAVDDIVLANDDVHMISLSGITPGGSPTDGDLLFFELERISATGTDLPEDARLLGIRVHYQNTAAQNWYINKMGNETDDAVIGERSAWVAPAAGYIHDIHSGVSLSAASAGLMVDVHKNGTSVLATSGVIAANTASTLTSPSTAHALTTTPIEFAQGDRISFITAEFGGSGAKGLHTDLLISWD